jgi:hypothetical protein
MNEKSIRSYGSFIERKRWAKNLIKCVTDIDKNEIQHEFTDD